MLRESRRQCPARECLPLALNNENNIEKENMEALVFALISVKNLYFREERVPAEPQTFQPLDLQSLRHVYGAKERSANRSTDRNGQHLAPTVS